MFNKPYVFLLLFIGSIQMIYAQSWNVITYKTQDGLSEEFITNVVSDNVGFVWLMTNSSVIRFDGNSFQQQDLGVNGRPLKFFKSYTTDSNYILTANYTVFTIHNGKLTQNNWLKNKQNVYLTLGQLAYELSGNTRVAFQNLTKDINNEEFIKYINNPHLYPISAHSFYGLLPNGQINIYDGQIKREVANRIFQNGCHMFMRNKELFVIDPKIKRVFSLLDTQTKDYALSKDDWQLFQKVKKVGRYTNPYFTDNSSVYELVFKGYNLQLVYLFKLDDVRLITDVKFCPILNIYYVASSHGFHMVRKKYFTHLIKSNASNLVSTLLPLNSMVVVPSNFIHNGSANTKLKANSIDNSMLFKDTLGNLLYTYKGKLLQYNAKYNKIKTVDSGFDRGTHMTYDSRNNIWISDYYHVFRYYGNQKQHVCNTLEHTAQIHKFILVDNSNILIATSKGLYKYDYINRKRLWIKLKGFEVRDLVRDSCYVLVSTYGKGIYRYDIRSDALEQFTTEVNHPLLYAHAFVRDSTNTYWISTNNGIVRIARSTLIQPIRGLLDPVKSAHYNSVDGLENMEMNGGASPCAVLDNDQIYMASMKGVVCFNPYTIPLPIINPYIGVDEVIADGNKVIQGAENILELPSSTKLIRFKINTPCVLTTSQHLVDYRIRNLDSVWIPLNEQKSIDLLGVPYGNYELEIRKRISNDELKYNLITFQFAIAPQYYQTWWFNVILVIVIISFAFSLTLFRTFLLKKQNEVLQNEVNTQTHDLRESKNQTDLLLSVLAHDIRSPLKSLEYIAAHIRSKLDDLETKELLSKMEVSLKAIDEFTSNHLIWYNLIRDNFMIKPNMISLAKVVYEIVNLHDVSFRERNNQIQVFVADTIHLTTDEDALKAILRNLIDNANKHTENGLITITAMMFQNVCELQITNPFNLSVTELEERIKPYFNQGQSVVQLNQKKNLGMFIISEICLRLNYTFKYSINYSKQTITFLLTMPITGKVDQ